MSGTGGVAGRSLANAMMCSKVMSVCVQTSATHTSWGVPLRFCATAAVALVGVRRRTCTTMGSRRMASTTASSWSTLEKSRPFTWRKNKRKTRFIRRFGSFKLIWETNSDVNHMVEEDKSFSYKTRQFKVEGDLISVFFNLDLSRDWQTCSACFTFTPGILTVPSHVDTEQLSVKQLPVKSPDKGHFGSNSW